MHKRLRWMQGATALLYLGPLLAGLAGQGWGAVPPFVAVFLFWLLVMRPWVFPRDLAQWQSPQVWVTAAGHLAVQVLLVVACFGIGRGLGGIMGVSPVLPPALPVALSFLSIPLSRLIWNPGSGPEIDRLLEDAIRSINDPNSRARQNHKAEQAVAPLLALPGDADPQMAEALVWQVLTGPEASDRLEELVYALNWVDPDRTALRRALLLWATDQNIAPRSTPFGTPRVAFDIAGHDPDLLSLFAQRSRPLLAAHPEIALAFPEPRDVAYTIDDSMPPEVNAALSALVGALEAAMAPAHRLGPNRG